MNRLTFIIIIAILILAGCSTNREKPINNYVPDVRILPFEGQAWLWEVPPGDYAIGISYSSTHFTDGSADAARDFAAVSLSRNHSSYIVDKHSLLQIASQDDADFRTADFNLVVSQDIGYLRRAVENLRLVHQFDTQGYFIGLYGFNHAIVDTSKLVMHPGEVPDWARRPGLKVAEGRIISTAASRQASLIDAYFVAQEMALRQIGRHLILKVMDDLKVENDIIKQMSAFESVSQSSPYNIDKVYIRKLMIDGNPSYEVSLQLEEAD